MNEKMVRLNADIPEDLRAQTRVIAAHEGMTVRELVILAMREKAIRRNERRGNFPRAGDPVHYTDQRLPKGSPCIEAVVKDVDGVRPGGGIPYGDRTVTMVSPDDPSQGIGFSYCPQDSLSDHPCTRPADRYWSTTAHGEARDESRWHWPE